MNYVPNPNEFLIDQTWTAIAALLTAQLGPGVDVDCIGEKDFDEFGDLTINPPAVRVQFGGERAGQPLETQNQVYNADQGFAVICAAENLSSVQSQRIVSVQLAGRVKHILIGARLLLATGYETEPIKYLGTEPLSTEGVGMAYVAQFIVPNIAQFAAPNAYPTGGN